MVWSKLEIKYKICLTDCLIKVNKKLSKLTFLIFHKNFRLYNKTSPFFVPRTVTVKGPPQGSQSGPAFAETGTEAFVVKRQFTFAPLTMH